MPVALGRTGRAVVVALCVATGLEVARAQSPPANPPVPSPPSPPAEVTPPVKFDVDKTLALARQTVRLFADRVKRDLTAAIKSDGAANAVSLCQTISPDLSTGLSDESGFEVTRTSLKLRNPESAPGPWELEVLNSFEQQAAAGVDAAKLERYEIVVSPEGDRLFRYMKGIPTAEMCLNCHGTDIRNDVKAELTRYYPDDKATGYRLGELRGAFSLVKVIGE